jgi:lipoprotein-releasing system permease protein
MNVPSFISGRYFHSRKGRNVIHLMSRVAIAGVFVGSMALITVLSVFNGFESLVKELYGTFDPDLLMIPAQGKTLHIPSDRMHKIRSVKGVRQCSGSLEENVLLKFNQQQTFARMKGLERSYLDSSALSQQIRVGKFSFGDSHHPLACLGQGVAATLGAHPDDVFSSLQVYLPDKTAGAEEIRTGSAFRSDRIYPGSVFSVQQDVDNKYFLVPIEFAKGIMDVPDEHYSTLEIRLNTGADEKKIKQELRLIAGDCRIQNKTEQHSLLFHIMQTEKWAVFSILLFILILASFNIVGSLTLLIHDKKQDLFILSAMGAGETTLKKIFFIHGMRITLYGAFLGVACGLLICAGQIHFGWLKLGDSGSFVVDAYPVKIMANDILLSLLGVSLIGAGAAIYTTAGLKTSFLKK